MKPWTIAAVALLTAAISHREADASIHTDRTDFVNAVGDVITDGYDSYGLAPGDTPLNLSDDAMTFVLGETRYQSLSFSNLNLVGDVYAYGDGTNYCAGCNGSFRLDFSGTSLSSSGGVHGVGVDIVFHTSRRASLGDDRPGDIVRDGTILIEYTDGTIDPFTVPADVGFFEPEVFFLGITDTRGIASLTFGTEPLSSRHSWAIDNLSIANAASDMPQVPEPASLVVWSVLAIVSVTVAWRQSRRTPLTSEQPGMVNRQTTF